MAELTSFQTGLLFTAIILIIAVVIIALFFISRKYPKEKQKLDPIYKAVLIVAILYIVFMLTPAIFGFIDKETIKERSWYFVIAAILLVVWYGVIVPYWLKRPISTIKLLNLYVLPDIRELYGGEMYKGDAYIPPFEASVVIPSENRGLKDIGNLSTLVEVFLVNIVYGGMGTRFQVLEVRDKFTGEGLRHQKNPSMSMVNALLEREVARSEIEPINEYDMPQPKQERAEK